MNAVIVNDFRLRTCGCGLRRPESEFQGTLCAVCRRAYHRKWEAENKRKVKEYRKKRDLERTRQVKRESAARARARAPWKQVWATQKWREKYPEKVVLQRYVEKIRRRVERIIKKTLGER